MYTFQDCKIWYTKIIAENEDIDGSISLCLDASGKAHITYYNYANDSLKYAVSQEPIRSSSAEIKKDDSLRESFGCFISLIIEDIK